MLVLRDWARLLDDDLGSYGRGIAWIVYEEFLGEAHILLVFRVLHIALHRYRDSVFHRRFHDDAFEGLPCCLCGIHTIIATPYANLVR